MFNKKQQEEIVPKFKEGEYSDELKKELEELHKFKWSHVLWPIVSIFLISGLLFYVYKTYIIRSTNSVIDRKSPAEKIQSKPDETREEPQEEAKPAVKTEEEAKPVVALTEDYTVKEGDTLGAIGTSKGVTIDEILKVNPGLTPETLQIGQVIKIPKK